MDDSSAPLALVPQSPWSATSAPHTCALVAGTFDILHEGHARLLRAAFAAAAHVEVWLTDDALCAAKAARLRQVLQPWSARAAGIAAWADARNAADAAAGAAMLRALSARTAAGGGVVVPVWEDGSGSNVLGAPSCSPYAGRYSLHALPDALGPAATEPRYTLLVCSEETLPACASINAARAQVGLAPLALVCVPLVCSCWGGVRDAGDEASAEGGVGGGACGDPACAKLSSTALRAGHQLR